MKHIEFIVSICLSIFICTYSCAKAENTPECIKDIEGLKYNTNYSDFDDENRFKQLNNTIASVVESIKNGCIEDKGMKKNYAGEIEKIKFAVYFFSNIHGQIKHVDSLLAEDADSIIIHNEIENIKSTMGDEKNKVKVSMLKEAARSFRVVINKKRNQLNGKIERPQKSTPPKAKEEKDEENKIVDNQKDIPSGMAKEKPPGKPAPSIVNGAPLSFSHFYENEILYLDTAKTIFLEFVLITKGKVKMGINKNGYQAVIKKAGLEAFDLDLEDEVINDETKRNLSIDYNFCIGKFEVSRKVYHFVMEHKIIKENPDLPVTGISENNIKIFLSKLNAMFPKLSFDIPKEKEWEYVAKGSSDFWYINTNDFVNVKEKINYHRNGTGKLLSISRAEVLGTSNGVMDMLGNAKEVCHTEIGLYPADKNRGGSKYVSRGGSYLESEYSTRCTSRHLTANPAAEAIGLRLVIRKK